MPQSVTMQMMADELGISRRTVSSVINNKARARGVCRRTEERVREHLRRRGYAPSFHARSLRAGVGETTGILYGGHLYRHLIEAFNSLISRFHDGRRRAEIALVRPGEAAQGLAELVGRGVSQLVWIHAGTPKTEISDFETVRHYLAKFSPCVIYNHRFDGTEWDERLLREGVHLVGVDRAEGFKRLGGLLKGSGHRQVCVPTATSFQPTAMDLQARAGLEAAGLRTCPCGPEGVPYEFTARYGEALAGAIQRSMKQHGVTAACFVNNELAGFTMAALLRRGIRIPGELSVTGYDGMPFAAALAVPLTTLSVPVPAMIDRVERIFRRPPANRRHCFPLTIVERASHGPAPQGTKEGGR